jgi:hypothetical protein
MPGLLNPVCNPISKKDPIEAAIKAIDLVFSGSLLKANRNRCRDFFRAISPTIMLKGGKF